MPSHYGNAVVLRVGTVYHCHCEERSDVAIRPPLRIRKTDCHASVRAGSGFVKDIFL